MPGTVRDLKTRLLEAIDTEGNVTNMEILCDVVTALESIQLTAEDLHVTRLGKFVNLARKKAKDRSLAKRLKNLVKRWQTLCTSNGLPAVLSVDTSLCAPTPPPLPPPSLLPPPPPSLPPPPPPSLLPPLSVSDGPLHTSTPIHQTTPPVLAPVETCVVQQSPTSLAPVQSIVTVSQPVCSSLSIPPAPSVGHKSDAIFNRRHKLQMLSQLNKRPASCNALSTSTPAVKPEAIEAELDRGVPDKHSDITSVAHTELIVSIPHVAMTKAFSKHPPTCANGSGPMTPPSPPPGYIHSSPTEQAISVVSPPSLDHTPNLATAPITEHALSLVVSIDTSRLRQSVASIVPSVSAYPAVNTVTITGPSEKTGIPTGCVPGIDGHLGQDGCWYDWTKAIPPIDRASVTVLPYVYIDDWDMMLDH